MHPTLRLALPLVSMIALAPSTALAQPPALVASPPPENVTPEEWKPWLAPTLSAGVALAGYGTALLASLPSGDIQAWQTGCLVGGLTLGVLGPSAGHVYTGHYGRAILFSTGRVLSAAIALAGLQGLIDHGDVSESDYRKNDTGNQALFVGGLAGVLALSIWEAVDSYRSAQSRNRQRGARSLALAPYVVPGGGASRLSVAGLVLAGQF